MMLKRLDPDLQDLPRRQIARSCRWSCKVEWSYHPCRALNLVHDQDRLFTTLSLPLTARHYLFFFTVYRSMMLIFACGIHLSWPAICFIGLYLASLLFTCVVHRMDEQKITIETRDSNISQPQEDEKATVKKWEHVNHASIRMNSINRSRTLQPKAALFENYKQQA